MVSARVHTHTNQKTRVHISWIITILREKIRQFFSFVYSDNYYEWCDIKMVCLWIGLFIEWSTRHSVLNEWNFIAFFSVVYWFWCWFFLFEIDICLKWLVQHIYDLIDMLRPKRFNFDFLSNIIGRKYFISALL